MTAPETEDVLCADGCGSPAERERPFGVTVDGELIVELVCRAHEDGVS